MYLLALAGLLLAVSHPVYPVSKDPARVESLKASVAWELARSPEELADMVPPQRGIAFTGCPSCRGGAQEYEVLEWKPGMGDTVRCKFCGVTYPNEKFPTNREKIIIAPSGREQVYRWYEDEQGNQFFFDALAWFVRSYSWVQSTSQQFAELYALTGDNAYGDRAAALIGRFAVVYPDYPMIYDWPNQPVKFWPADQKWPYEGAASTSVPSKLYHWAYGDIPRGAIRAYDTLLGAGYDFKRVEAITAPGIKELIDDNLIEMSYEFFVARPDQSNNMMPYIYADMIVAGRVGGHPEMIHHALNGSRKLGVGQYFYDGWWYEGTGSYHWQTVGGMLGVDSVLKGYSDPPDFPGKRLENTDLLKELPLLGRAAKVAEEAVFPDGRMIPINDTHSYDKRTPLSKSVSRLWGGLGHAALAAGTGENQFQAHLNWSGNFGHDHHDNGSIILFAFGKEMLSDIGYTHTKFRNWTVQSASHNMVVVDTLSAPRRSGDPLNGMGNALFYDGSDEHVAVADVDARPAYPACDVYRRRLVHVHVAEGRDYVIDLFDVKGGQTHDYFLHGSADEKGQLTTTPTLSTPVETLVPEWGGRGEYKSQYDGDMDGKRFHAYDMLRKITRAPAADPSVVQWSYGNVGLRTRLFAPPGSELYSFESPTVRNAGEDDNRLADHYGDGIMLRNTGGNSRFAALHEPFQGAPWIKSARYADGEFTVEHEGGRETITFTDHRVRVRSTAGWSYDSGEPATGRLAAVERDNGFAFKLDRPAGDLRAIRIQFPDGPSHVYPVAAVEGDRVKLAEDPGFALDAAAGKAEFLYFPNTSYTGTVNYVAFPR